MREDILQAADNDFEALLYAVVDMVESGCRSKAEAEQKVRSCAQWLMKAVNESPERWAKRAAAVREQAPTVPW